MKTFNVSFQCTVFAYVEVEAENRTEAEAKARKCRPQEFDIERHTLTPESVEQITEMDK